jgi:hypothetical protein
MKTNAKNVPAKKLTLAKETLRQLDPGALDQVRGGSMGCTGTTNQTVLCKRK